MFALHHMSWSVGQCRKGFFVGVSCFSSTFVNTQKTTPEKKILGQISTAHFLVWPEVIHEIGFNAEYIYFCTYFCLHFRISLPPLKKKSIYTQYMCLWFYSSSFVRLWFSQPYYFSGTNVILNKRDRSHCSILNYIGFFTNFMF